MSWKAWFESHTRGPRLLQLALYGLVFTVLLIYVVNVPASLRQWRFYGTVSALAALLVVNVLWASPIPPASSRRRTAQDWAFLGLSSGLILTAAWFSGLAKLAYLQSLVVGQAGLRRGVWPAGLLFAAVMLAVWLGLLAWLGVPYAAIVPTASALIVRFIFRQTLSRAAGYGLQGLRERAWQLGGSFRSGPGPLQGFAIELCIPFEGNCHDPRTAGRRSDPGASGHPGAAGA